VGNKGGEVGLMSLYIEGRGFRHLLPSRKENVGGMEEGAEGEKARKAYFVNPR